MQASFQKAAFGWLNYGMLLLYLLAMVWITLLRRQVEQRTAQLRVEIQERERAEKIFAAIERAH